MSRPTAYQTGPEDAELIILVHGAPDRRTAFRRVQRHLPEFRVVTYDRRGYGESAALPLAASLADHAHDLLRVLEGRRAVVVGHSFGGNVALHAVTLQPELFAAVGIWESSMCWLPGWPAEHIDEVRALAETDDTRMLGERMGRALIGPTAWDRLDEAGRELRRVEGHAFALDMSFILEEPYDVHDVKVPFSHGVGGDTEGAHSVGARLLAQQTGVDAVVVDGVSHLAHIQAPHQWAQFVRAVLALVRPAQAAESGRA
jgi:pimeloyl-ACP methyl ester carboxylesterase